MSKKNTAEKPKKKTKPRKFLTPAQWTQLRTIWEMGQNTFRELADTWDISESIIKQRSSKEQWVRHGKEAELKKKIEESTVEIFARLGMPKERYLKLVLDGALGTKGLKNVKQATKDKDGNPLKTKAGKPIIIEQTIQVEDNDITLRYRELIAKLSGFYAPPKATVDAEENGGTAAEIPVVSHIQRVQE